MTTWRPWYIQKILGIWIFLFCYYELWESRWSFLRRKFWQTAEIPWTLMTLHHQAFLVMILEFQTIMILLPHLLYSFAFYVLQAIFYIPSHDSRLKGRTTGGFATKSVFHEASRVSLMVMLMEICWRVEISHNRYNMTFCHEMLFATVPDGKYYSIWYCNIPQCIHFLR